MNEGHLLALSLQQTRLRPALHMLSTHHNYVSNIGGCYHIYFFNWCGL